MTSIREVLKAKGEQIWWVQVEALVYDALKLMMEKDVGALLVLDGGKLVGTISERDYARKVVLQGRSSKVMPVREVMTREVPSVRPNQCIEEGIALMTESRLRHLPVVDAGEVLGVISMGDLLQRMILEQKSVIEQLGREMAERKRMQQEVLEAQNLASLGEMAASVAHEIRNPVAGIRGVIEVIEETMPRGDPRREVMQEVVAQIDRLDNTVQQLLVLSRPWRAQTQLCDLRRLVEQLILSTNGRRPLDSVRIAFGGRRSVLVPVDPLLFERVLWNLLENAADAMPEGGEIDIRFGETDECATLSVTDQGVGIPSELQHRLFRPFFTTKTRGTGLGLSICKKILNAHGGTIAISSRPGRGTRVTLTLPKKA